MEEVQIDMKLFSDIEITKVQITNELCQEFHNGLILSLTARRVYVYINAVRSVIYPSGCMPLSGYLLPLF